MHGPITLLTDFGTADGYAGAMKGVIATLAPDAAIHDISHDIEPGDIAGAAFALRRYAWRYPRGTVHVVVVDPGVGTARRPLVVEAAGRYFVGPDNGIFTPAFEREHRAFAIDVARISGDEVSATFHGRDIFAPAAARLARGEMPESFGTAASDSVHAALPRPVRSGCEVRGIVVACDRFGNLITNLRREDVPAGSRIEFRGLDLGTVRRTYADAADGETLALFGSDGWLEVAVRGGSAGDDGVREGCVGEAVVVRHPAEE